MRKLLLVRHSLPVQDENIPPHEWELSEPGLDACTRLCALLKSFRPGGVYTSPERKAIQTGEIVATNFELPLRVEDDLHEHDRRQEPFLPQADFEAAIRRFFADPAPRVYGAESANQAFERFDGAFKRIVVAQPDERDVVMVSHGTVMSVFVSHYTTHDAYTLWQQLTPPSLLVLSLPKLEIEQIHSPI